MSDLGLIPTPNDPTPFTQAAQSEADKSLLVRFFVKARENREASAREGRPVFSDVEYIDIKIPGSKSGACRPATARDKQRFPEHYRAFKDRQEAPEVGTPLAMWPPISRSMVEQLAFFNVKTVEQLAAVPDSSLPNIMGFQRFKQLAISFLEAAKSDAPLAQLRAELEERDAKLSAQAGTIEALTARLEALEARESPPEPTLPATPAPVPEPVSEPDVPAGGYQSVLDAGGEAPAAEEASPDAAPDSPAGKPRRRRRSTA